MRYIGVKLVGCIVFLGIAAVSDPGTTVVAVIAANMVLVAAPPAAIGQFTAGHCHKGAVTSLNDLQIADHKAIIESYRTEGPQTIFRFLHQFDSNFGDIHSQLPPMLMLFVVTTTA